MWFFYTIILWLVTSRRLLHVCLVTEVLLKYSIRLDYFYWFSWSMTTSREESKQTNKNHHWAPGSVGAAGAQWGQICLDWICCCQVNKDIEVKIWTAAWARGAGMTCEGDHSYRRRHETLDPTREPPKSLQTGRSSFWRGGGWGWVLIRVRGERKVNVMFSVQPAGPVTFQ